jgi:hypothetical protein
VNHILGRINLDSAGFHAILNGLQVKTHELFLEYLWTMIDYKSNHGKEAMDKRVILVFFSAHSC